MAEQTPKDNQDKKEEKPLLKFTASVKPRRSKPIPPEVWKKQYKADEQKKEDKN